MRPHHPLPRFSFLVCLLLSPFSACIVNAAVSTLYSENFSNVSSLNANGWYFWNNSSAGTAWTVSAAGTDTLPLQGNLLRNLAGGSANTSAMLQFSPVTLSASDDFVRVSLDVYTAITDSTKQLQIGFYDVGSPITANVFGGTNPIAGKTGYAQGQAFTTSTVTYSDRVGTTVGSSLSSGAVAGGTFTASQPHTVIFTLTKTSGGLSLSSTFDGVVMSSYTLSGVNGNVTLDTLWLLTGGIGSAVNFDNITITTNAIPEPSTIATLLGGSVLFGAFIFKRRRHAHA